MLNDFLKILIVLLKYFYVIILRILSFFVFNVIFPIIELFYYDFLFSRDKEISLCIWYFHFIVSVHFFNSILTFYVPFSSDNSVFSPPTRWLRIRDYLETPKRISWHKGIVDQIMAIIWWNLFSFLLQKFSYGFFLLLSPLLFF